MPMYPFKCDGCGHAFDDFRTMAERDDETLCPKCMKNCTRQIAGMHTDTGYQKPILSDALGIHPDQIAEAQQRFPHHKFAPDGRMILESHQERKRVMKDLGMVDHQGYH